MVITNEFNEKQTIQFKDNYLYNNYEEKEKIKKSFFTVYSSGEILYKSPRNFLPIHFYNYLYQAKIITNKRECIYYTKSKHNFIEVFSPLFNKQNSNLKIENLIQDADLPIVEINDDTKLILLKEKEFYLFSQYLYSNFPKFTIKKIPLKNINREDIEKYNYVKLNFMLDTVFIFYKIIFLLMLLVINSVFLYAAMQKMISYAIFGIIFLASILIFIIILFLLNLLKKKLLKKKK